MDLNELKEELMLEFPNINESELDSLLNNKRSLNSFLKLVEDIRNDNEFNELVFTYPDEIKPAPRPRVGRGGFMYDPGSKDKKDISKFLKENIVSQLNNGELIAGEIHMDIKLYKSIPKSKSIGFKLLADAGVIRPEVRPDVDNYMKTPLDAMNDVLWEDDSTITSISFDKYYSFNPRTEFIIRYRNKRRG